MVRLKVKRGFYDKEAKQYRATGEEFEVAESRARVIISAGVVTSVGKVVDSKTRSKKDGEGKGTAKEAEKDGKK